MRRRALLMGGKQQLPLIIRVDTTKSGVTPSDTFRIPANAPGETYRFKVDWGDGVVTSNHTGNAEHTYLSGGVYDIKIFGKFPKFYFNNGGDRLKLLEVRHWGDINYSTSQASAFYGCSNLTFIATDENEWYNNIIFAQGMFRLCGLSSVPDNLILSSLTNGNQMFRGCSITSLPDGMTLNLVTDGGYMFKDNSLTTLPNSISLSSLNSAIYMFENNSLTSLPDGMELGNLTNGNYMFTGNSLTSLPDGMTLSSLTNGNNMFRDNSLTSLPDGMTLGNLTNGDSMFRNNSLTSLPDVMTLENLTTGSYMFENNSLTSLPTGMTLGNLTNGSFMFTGNSLTSLPDGMTLNNLTNGHWMFRDNPITSAIGLNLHKINSGLLFMNVANLPSNQYSNILVDIEANNPNNGVNIYFGSSKYNATGQVARNILTSAPRNWAITDGGLE